VRKKYIVGAILGALVIALGGSALTFAKAGKGPNHKFDFTFSKPKAGAATGVSKILTDRYTYTPPPSGTAANPVTKIVFKTPKGTKIDTSILGSKSKLNKCTKSKLGSSGNPVATKCPKISSKRGSAEAITGIAAVDPLKENVDVYAATKQFVVRLTPKGAVGQTANIFISLKGRTLTAVVPPFCLPGDNAATPQCDNGEAVLTKLTVFIKKVVKNGKSLITYGKCPKSHVNKTTATYSFRTTPKEKVTSTQKCKP
jgi:hypothetical protein